MCDVDNVGKKGRRRHSRDSAFPERPGERLLFDDVIRRVSTNKMRAREGEARRWRVTLYVYTHKLSLAAPSGICVRAPRRGTTQDAGTVQGISL